MTLLEGHKTVNVKWIFKTKRNGKGQVEKYKTRLVVKGYTQQYKIHYKDVFVPVT
jgi:hypothetical protein